MSGWKTWYAVDGFWLMVIFLCKKKSLCTNVWDTFWCHYQLYLCSKIDQSTKAEVDVQSFSLVAPKTLTIPYFHFRLCLKLKTMHRITTSHCCLVHMDIPHTEDHKKWKMNVAKNNKPPSIIQNVIAMLYNIFAHTYNQNQFK